MKCIQSSTCKSASQSFWKHWQRCMWSFRKISFNFVLFCFASTVSLLLQTFLIRQEMRVWVTKQEALIYFCHQVKYSTKTYNHARYRVWIAVREITNKLNVRQLSCKCRAHVSLLQMTSGILNTSISVSFKCQFFCRFPLIMEINLVAKGRSRKANVIWVLVTYLRGLSKYASKLRTLRTVQTSSRIIMNVCLAFADYLSLCDSFVLTLDKKGMRK